MPFLAAIKELKLRSFVQPGQKIALDATLAHDGSGFAMTRARGRVEGKLVCDAPLTFRVVEFPNPQMRGHMEALAKVLEFPMGALADG